MKFPRVIKYRSAAQNNRATSSHQRPKKEELPPTPNKRFGFSARRQKPLQRQYEHVTNTAATRHQRTGFKFGSHNEEKHIDGKEETVRDRVGLSTNPKLEASTRQKQSHLNRIGRFCSKRHQKKDKGRVEINQRDTDQDHNRVEKEPPQREQCQNQQIRPEQKRKLHLHPAGYNNDNGSNAIYSASSSFEALWASDNTVSVKTKETRYVDVVDKKNRRKPVHMEMIDDERISTTKAMKKPMKNHLEQKQKVSKKLTSRQKAKENDSANSTLTPKRLQKDDKTERRSPHRPKHISPVATSLSRTPRRSDVPKKKSRIIPSAQLTPTCKQSNQRATNSHPRVLQTKTSTKRKPSTPKKRENQTIRPVDESKKSRNKNLVCTIKNVALDESPETSRTERTTSSTCPLDSSYSSRARSRSISGRSSSGRSRSRRSRSRRSSSEKCSSSRARSKSRTRSSSRKRRSSSRKMRVEDARKILNPTDHPTYFIRPVHSSSEEDSLSHGSFSLRKEPKSPSSLKPPKRRSKRNPSKERGFSGLSFRETRSRGGRRPNRHLQETKTREDSLKTKASKSPKVESSTFCIETMQPSITVASATEPHRVKKSKAFSQYPNPFVKPH